jgi:hypothetical protein
MKLLKTCVLLACLLPVVTVATPRIAGVTLNETDFPVGLWNTTHYKKNDPTRKALHIKVCIQADGTWQSLNSADGMGGRWTRTGDDVHLSGNGLGLGGTGDMTLVTPYKMMTGTWQSWSITEPTQQHVAFNSRWNLVQANSCTLSN